MLNSITVLFINQDKNGQQSLSELDFLCMIPRFKNLALTLPLVVNAMTMRR